MIWRNRNFKAEVAQKQREADSALAQTKVSYMSALNLQLASERIARGLDKMQTENNFGYRLFGVEE